MKKVFLITFIITIPGSLAQNGEEDISSAVAADTIIDNGWLILHGRLLERPYHFHLEHDTFWINDMQYLPPPPNPLQKLPEFVPEYTELGKWFFEISEIFIDSCQAKYKLWRQKFGAAKAMNSLIQYINSQKIVKIKSVKRSDYAVIITYDYRHLDLLKNPTPAMVEAFTKPGAEYLEISMTFLGETNEDRKQKPLSQGEIFLREYKRIKELLIEGMFLHLHYSGWSEYGRAKGHEKRYINLIRGILAKPISETEMKKELKEELGIDSLESQYIIHSRSYWLNCLEGGEND